MSLPFSEQVDVVIVGSGPTGAAYARTLANEWPDARILMVDAGPIIADPPGLHVANIRDLAEREAAQIASQGPYRNAAYPLISEEMRRARRGGGYDPAMLQRPGLFGLGDGPIDGEGFPAAQAAHNVGGMGSHWFGACPRPAESERIPFIDRATMDEALTAAEGMLRVSNAQFRDSRIARALEPILGGLFNDGRSPDRRVQLMPMAFVVTADGVQRSGPNVILGDLLSGASPGFELRPDTVCRRIIVEGDRATGVELQATHTHETVRVGAGTVVVAADSLHSPQLLFASGIRPPALGHYLNEHPQVTTLAEFDAVDPGEAKALSTGGGVLADRNVVARMPSGVTWIPYNGESFPFHVQISQVEPASLPPEDQDIAKRTAVISVSFFLPSDLQYENRVEFSDAETDWHGRPKIKLRFRQSERDRERMALARETQARICAAVGRQLPGIQPLTPPDGSSLHYQGTMRMGDKDDGTSVCDRNSRVWGIGNVYVAGNGIIPTMTAGNPTLTSVALAVMGARHIAREHAGG